MARNRVVEQRKEQQSPLQKFKPSRKIDTTGKALTVGSSYNELKSFDLLENGKLFNKTSLFERNVEKKISQGSGLDSKAVVTKEYAVKSVSSKGVTLSSNIYGDLDSATKAFNGE